MSSEPRRMAHGATLIADLIDARERHGAREAAIRRSALVHHAHRERDRRDFYRRERASGRVRAIAAAQVAVLPGPGTYAFLKRQRVKADLAEATHRGRPRRPE